MSRDALPDPMRIGGLGSGSPDWHGGYDLDALLRELTDELRRLGSSYETSVRHAIEQHQMRLAGVIRSDDPSGSVDGADRLASFAVQAQYRPSVIGDDLPDSGTSSVDHVGKVKSVQSAVVREKPAGLSRLTSPTLECPELAEVSKVSSSTSGLRIIEEDVPSPVSGATSSFSKRLATERNSSRRSVGIPGQTDESEPKIMGLISGMETSRADCIIGALVMLNSFAMAMELECDGQANAAFVGITPGINCADNGWVFVVLEHLFTWIFAVEIFFRLWLHRCRYFHDYFNIFDFTLVILPILDLYVFTPLAGYSHNIEMLRVLRLGKMVRAVRIMRTLRLFQGLRLLVQACSSFLPSLAWSMILLMICMMVGGLVMGNLLQEFIRDETNAADKRLWVWTYYGTAYRAMYTMYEITFAGNWTTRARPVLEDVDHSYVIFFVFYVTLIVFAVLRVITAVFLRETLEAANNDAELVILERLRQKGKYIKRLEGIFRAMDESGDGVLSEEEMTLVLQDHKVQAYLSSLDLDLSEGQALYKLLQNSEGQVTYEDFIDGILRCKGPARAIDQICLQCDVKLLSDSVSYLTSALEDAKLIKKKKEQRKQPAKKRTVEDDVVLLRAATRPLK